ncbi:CTLH/CRA C-terminal to lish motif domain-containing protein [Russula earlei]|uniref:CTLH/CRA C-terminal to lish motif domain-containing protein n=1 Tax=Russula earlei TaxID=71964 RepID=A0ACC0UMF4_9AGAM|nr:CTLH/CRA C-terminal to lish motif domain-containing protein [Russula earlei]
MPPTKRLKRSHETHVETDESDGISAPETSSSLNGRQSPDTEDEIAEARLAKSKKTLKRKQRHRATDPSNFSATLQTLLKTDAPSGLPLSLKPSASQRHTDEKLELKARKLLKGEKKSREEVGRIKDVIGGWGVESERALRKIAQRGGESGPPSSSACTLTKETYVYSVVKLFNAIQQSQVSAVVAEKEIKEARGSGKPTLPAPLFDKRSHTRKGKNKDNPLGRGKESVDKDNFMDMIRSGGIVSKSAPKAIIPKDEWDRRLEEVIVSKADLNRLVMDYLVIEGYKSAAEEFSLEAGVQPAVDFASIESRRNIREALNRGDVQEAIARVNDLNPEILDTNPALYFHLQQQKLIEYIRQGKTTEALRFAQEELAPRGEESPEFLAELERTMALLAFESSSTVPPAISDLLSPGQRMKTAGEVNAAILESLSQGREAKLVALLKLLQWGETLLEERAEFPKVDLNMCDEIN